MSISIPIPMYFSIYIYTTIPYTYIQLFPHLNTTFISATPMYLTPHALSNSFSSLISQTGEQLHAELESANRGESTSATTAAVVKPPDTTTI